MRGKLLKLDLLIQYGVATFQSALRKSGGKEENDVYDHGAELPEKN